MAEFTLYALLILSINKGRVKMARIAGVDLPRNKRLEYALPYIYGIGLSLSQKIIAQTDVDPNIRVKDLSDNEASKLREIIEKSYKVEGDLDREVKQNIKRLMDIGLLSWSSSSS